MTFRHALTLRRTLLALGCGLIILFSASIVDSMISGPRCWDCHGLLYVHEHTDNQWLNRTIWRCRSCRKFTVHHVNKHGVDVQTKRTR